MTTLSRRQFLGQAARWTSAGLALLGSDPWGARGADTALPSYLKGYEKLYAQNPRQAALEWFQGARYGLFIHYSLASLLPSGKQELQKMTTAEGKALQARFTAAQFDAHFITDLALEAGMRYITFTTKHLVGLCMFRTTLTDFTSLNAPAHRDLVGELAAACHQKGLGFFAYCPPEIAVTTPDVWEQNRTYYRELLTPYGPIAGIWQDGIGRYYPHPQLYTGLDRNYAMIRSLQPQGLISFKNGATGEEDFLAPEHTFTPTRGKQSLEAWEKLKDKPVEICTTMQLGRSLLMNNESAKHMTAADVLAEIKSVTSRGYNLLLNTGLRGDGSVHPADVQALREAGARLKREGFPQAVRPAARPTSVPAPPADQKHKPKPRSPSKSAE